MHSDGVGIAQDRGAREFTFETAGSATASCGWHPVALVDMARSLDTGTSSRIQEIGNPASCAALSYRI